MGRIKKKKILLVEDDVLIAMAEQKALEEYNYHVKTAHTGEKAIKAIQKESFDLVLMDINLGPGMDGTEAAQKILSFIDLPIVFLSSHTEKNIVEKTEKITSYGYVVKNTGIIVLDTSIKMAFKLFEERQKTETQRLHLSTTLNSIGDAVIATDLKGNIIRMNPVAEVLTGWNMEEAKRKPLASVLHVVDAVTRQPVEDSVKKVLNSGGRQETANNTILIDKQGAEHQITESGAPIQDDFGKVSGVVLVFRDMTEHYKIRDKKTAYELQINNLFKLVGDGVAIRYLEGNIIDANQNFLDLFGYSREELVGSHFSKLITPESDNLAITENAREQLNKEGFVRFEANFITRQGNQLKGEITSSIVDAGDKKLVQTIFRNITKRKQAEEAVREEKDQMQKYLDIAGVIFVAIDRKGTVSLINRRGQEILGGKESEIIGKNWFDTYLPDDYRKQVKEIFEQAMKGDVEMPEYFENTILNKNGEERVIAWHNTVLYDESGKITGTLSSGNDITERKQAEEALNRSETLFRAIIEQSGEGIGVADEQGNCIVANPAFCFMTGYTASELLSMSIPDILPPKTELELTSKVLKNQAGQREVELVKKDGSRFLAEISAYPVNLEDKRLVLAIIRDITDQYESELALIESENKFRSIAQNASDLIFIKDSDRKYTFVNNAMAAYMGYSEPEALGRTSADDLEEKQELIIKDLDDRAFAGETVNKTIKIVVNNEIRFLSSILTPLNLEKGKVVSIMGIIRDMTDQILTQYQVETIYRTATYMMCIADINTATFVRVNPAFSIVLGYSEQELLERPFLEFIHPDDIEATNAVIEDDLKAGKNVSNYQNRYRTKSGEYRWLDWTSHSIPEDGVAYAIGRDVTESRESQEKIHSLLKEKELLLQEVHHRIKNNMIVVKSLLSLQASNVEEALAREALETAQKRLTSMMLLYDKIYRSKHKDEICLRDYLSSLVDEIIMTYTKTVEIIKNMESVVVSVQTASPLGIIVNELISNAMKYAFKGGEDNRLEISLARKDSMVTLVIRDNGKGFDDSVSGKGFGLELVKNLSLQIDGEFGIERDNGAKCILTFEIDE